MSTAQEELANVRLGAVSLDSKIRDIKYQTGSDVESLYVFKGQRSQTFDYRGAKDIVFFRESGQLDAEGNPIRIKVGQCALPATTGQYLLLFSQQSEDPEQYRIFAISDDWKTFNSGTYRFLNLAPFDIALRLDDTVHRIKERNFTDVPADFTNASNHKAVMVSLPDGEDPMRVFEGEIYFTENLRMLYLINPKEGGRPGRVNFMAIPQAIPKTAPADETSQ